MLARGTGTAAPQAQLTCSVVLHLMNRLVRARGQQLETTRERTVFARASSGSRARPLARIFVQFLAVAVAQPRLAPLSRGAACRFPYRWEVTTQHQHLHNSKHPRRRLLRGDSHYSPMHYPGGKRDLLPHTQTWLASLHGAAHLVEPFAGGACVGVTALAKGLVKYLTLVELDPRVFQFWQTVFSDDGYELASRLLRVPTRDAAFRVLEGQPPRNRVDEALHLLLLNRLRFNGNLTDSAGFVRRDHDARFSVAMYARRIEILADLRDFVEVRHGDAFDVLLQYRKARDVAFYLDPPYSLPGGEAETLYDCWELDHPRLFELAGSLQGPVLISHQDHPDVHALARLHRFKVAQVEISMAGGRAGNELLMARDLSWVETGHRARVHVLPSSDLELLSTLGLAPLLTFTAVAEERQYTAAAKRLGVHVSNATRHVQKLETALDVPLLTRTTHEVTVTAAGIALYTRVRAALEMLDEALVRAGTPDARPGAER